MENVNQNLLFLDMLKDQLIEHQEKQIIGLINMNKSVEGFLKKLANLKNYLKKKLKKRNQNNNNNN